MARKVGDKNRDFERKREQILDALQVRLLREDAARITMNEMAVAADVSLSTLRHHFGTRSDVVAAVLERLGRLGAPYIASAVAPPEGDVQSSLTWLLHSLLRGLQYGLSDMMGMGISLGMRDPTVGPAFLQTILEPVLQSVEARLEHHVRSGELVATTDVRLAALTLVSPLLLGTLHQRGLCGDTVRPLQLDGMVAAQVRHFLRGYAAA
ncbi:MAG: TetR/AcrR family transcriptional regulator [Pseudomonadota bacterium]|nr:TetR/AcrR family transcriptional regulator [Pseudomonadota bacterium]